MAHYLVVARGVFSLDIHCMLDNFHLAVAQALGALERSDGYCKYQVLLISEGRFYDANLSTDDTDDQPEILYSVQKVEQPPVITKVEFSELGKSLFETPHV